MKVFGNDKFRVYVHKLDHPPPHCHVKFKDSEVCVTIPLLEPMHGLIISREVKLELEKNLDAIADEWDRLHPKKKPKVKKTKKSKRKIK